MARRVLVVGAGIGGDALALSLGRAGWEVVVAEIAPGLRTGGQTVDLRGPSAEVLDRLGLLDECLRHLVPQAGIAWVDARGRRLAEMGVEAFDGQGFVSREELLRTDLARVLHDATGPGVEHRFSETAERLEPTPDGVRVTFRQHEPETFDLVVGADGTHSRVRSLTFGPEERFRRPLGLAHARFTLPEGPTTPALDGWFLVHNAPGSRVVEARPGHPGEQEVGFTFASGTLPDRRDRAARDALLRTTFADVGWRAPELLDALGDTENLALDTFDQIHADRWHDGRVVLLGDSAWCASPLSGLGTALALEGAYVLSGLLTAGATAGTPVETSLSRYQELMRPRTDAAQRLLPGRVPSYAPRTALGIRATAAVYRLIQTRPALAMIQRMAARSGHAPGLPDLAA
jgi:2-polyprenyl-6-methoxyphenol hydroxylase-like FAD-dependent oxidoreductase